MSDASTEKPIRIKKPKLTKQGLPMKDNPTKNGGARPGAGRPAGSKSKLNLAKAQTLVDLMYDRTGKVYEEILFEDFMNARENDRNLTHKYHALLANKLMPDLNHIEINDNTENIDAKEKAFSDALQALSNLHKKENK